MRFKSKNLLCVAVITGALAHSAFADSERDERQALRETQFLVSNGTKIVGNTNYTPELIERLSKEIESCGLKLAAPDCLDSSFDQNDSGLTHASIETSDSFIFFFRLTQHVQPQHKNFAIAIEVEKDKSISAVRSVTILAAGENTQLEMLKNDFLLGRTKRVLEVSTPEKHLEFLAAAIAGEPDFRKLYHFSRILSRSGDKKYDQTVLDSLKNRYRTLIESNSPAYQQALLELLHDVFPQETELAMTAAQELLMAADPSVSQLAAITLAENGRVTAEVTALLKNGLRNANSKLRLSALRVFGLNLSGKEDENTVLGMVLDSSPEVRSAAFALSANMTLNNENLSVLEKAIQSSDWSSRRNALTLLARIRTHESTNLILPSLADSDSDVQKLAIRTLDSRSLGDQDVAQLGELAKRSNLSGRSSIAKLLGAIQTPSSIVILSRLANDSDWTIRREAVKSLGKNDSAGATEAMIASLADLDSDVRATTVALLNARTLSDAQVPMLTSAAGSSNALTKSAVIQQLGRIQSPASVSVLSSFVSGSSWNIRRDAVIALAKNPDPVATVALIGFLGDSDSDVRASALTPLNQRTLTENEVPALAKAARSSTPEARSKVAQQLGRIATSSSVAALSQFTRDSAWTVRRDAVNALGKIPSTDSNSAMIGYLADTDADVRGSAVAQLGSRTLTNIELQALQGLIHTGQEEGRVNLVRFVAKVSTPESTEVLIQMMGDSSWRVRLGVAKALSAVITPNSTSALLKMTQDNDGDVKQAASGALRSRSFEDHISELAGYLDSRDWNTRALFAGYLGTTSSCEAASSLKNRLVRENDGDVTAAIKKAIQAIQGRNASCQ